jgi:hypothetical protein
VTPTFITWAAGAVVAILLGIFGYLIHLSDRMGDLKKDCTDNIAKVSKDVEIIQKERELTCEAHGKALALLPDMQRSLDRLLYRQELQDAHAADALHSPQHEERDNLVERLLKGELRLDEIDRVICLLKQAMREEELPDKRWTAFLLLGRAEVEQEKLLRTQREVHERLWGVKHAG